VGSIKVIVAASPLARDAIVVVFTGTAPFDTSLAYRATGIFVAADGPLFLTLVIFTGFGSFAKTALAGMGFTVPEIVRSH